MPEKTFLNRRRGPDRALGGGEDRDELAAAVARIGLPAVLKTTRLGYDGKGQAMLRQTGRPCPGVCSAVA